MSDVQAEEPGPNVVSREKFLRVIEGGRNIEGNDVAARFAAATEALSVECAPMAGFAVVVWDDEGRMHSDVHAGMRTPFSTMAIPQYAADLFKADIIKGTPA